MPNRTDPYAADSAYLRYHLVRLIVEKVGSGIVEVQDEAIDFLNKLATFIHEGSAIKEDDDDEGEAENVQLDILSGAYL